MKKRKHILIGLLLAGLMVPQVMPVQTIAAAEEAKQLDIMFLHDTHSHLNTFTTVTADGTKEVGGFSRIKTVIDAQKAAKLCVHFPRRQR